MVMPNVMKSLFDHSGLGLEIGPSHAPLFPKAEGYNVEILDHAPAEVLRAKYGEIGIDTSRIEEVDYVSDGRLIHEVIPHRKHYDFIYSSHAIEHITDFVGYFESCAKLLKPNGRVVLAIPDKRYTFDVFRQLTTTGRVLEAHAKTASRHSPAAMFDFISSSGSMSGQIAWSNQDRGTLNLENNLFQAKAVFDDTLRPDHDYHDAHGWIFTPSSFRLLMHELFELGLTPFREHNMVEVGMLEFYVTMSADAPGHGLSRLDLHKAIIRENVMSGLQLLAAEDTAMSAGYAAATAPPAPTEPVAPPTTESDKLRFRPVHYRLVKRILRATRRFVRSLH